MTNDTVTCPEIACKPTHRDSIWWTQPDRQEARTADMNCVKMGADGSRVSIFCFSI